MPILTQAPSQPPEQIEIEQLLLHWVCQSAPSPPPQARTSAKPSGTGSRRSGPVNGLEALAA
jgi:hypothetical protein